MDRVGGGIREIQLREIQREANAIVPATVKAWARALGEKGRDVQDWKINWVVKGGI